ANLTALSSRAKRGTLRYSPRFRLEFRSTAESIQAGYIAPDDQGMNVMCAFVREDALQIHDVSDHRILISDAGSPQNVPCLSSPLQRHPDIVAFRHRNLGST